MSFIKKNEKDYKEGVISLSELDDIRSHYSKLSDKDKLTLDSQSIDKKEETINQYLSTSSNNIESSIKQHNPLKNQKKIKKNEIKVASDGWIVAGFVFALLGGYIGIAMGMNYAFGNYKSETKTTGVVMLVISVLSFSIWRSL